LNIKELCGKAVGCLLGFISQVTGVQFLLPLPVKVKQGFEVRSGLKEKKLK